jgi:ketosteroid isomerase-like protein
MTVEQEIDQLERRRFAAQVSKDYVTLEQLFADDLVYTHANGHRDTKASYIESIRAGKSRYDQVDIDELLVRPYNDGQAAVVNGTIRINLGPGADGQPNMTHIKYVTVQIKNPGQGWQVVLWHAQKQAS